MDFLTHLEEFRKRLISSLFFFLLACILSFFFTRPILDFLMAPIQKIEGVEIIFQKPYEAFAVHLKTALLSGLFLSLPVLFYQLWLFVAPGLYDKEKRFLFPVILISVLLFLAGAFFAYGFVVPWGLAFLLSYQTETLRPLLSIGSYFSFLTGMILAFGVLFEFPLAVIGLVGFGVVKTRSLAAARKGILVGIFIAAAILTPSPDPFSQILLAIPLWLLFEISLGIAGAIEHKKGLRAGGPKH